MEYFVKFVAMTSHKYSEKLKSKISFNDDIIYILEFNNISKKMIFTHHFQVLPMYMQNPKKRLFNRSKMFFQKI